MDKFIFSECVYVFWASIFLLLYIILQEMAQSLNLQYFIHKYPHSVVFKKKNVKLELKHIPKTT
jgi:hypothetical protein